MPISTEGSDMPITRPKTGSPVYSLGARGERVKGTVFYFERGYKSPKEGRRGLCILMMRSKRLLYYVIFIMHL